MSGHPPSTPDVHIIPDSDNARMLPKVVPVSTYQLLQHDHDYGNQLIYCAYLKAHNYNFIK